MIRGFEFSNKPHKVIAQMTGGFKYWFAGFAMALGLFGCGGEDLGEGNWVRPNRLAEKLDEVGAKSVFMNPTAAALLDGDGVESDWAACKEAGVWRKMDRASRFDAVLLAGPPGEYQGLVSHLLESPDFRLVGLDPWGVLFVRGLPEAIDAPTVAAIEDEYSEDPGEALSRMALVLDTVGKRREAAEFMAEALKVGDGSAPIWTRNATLMLQSGRSREAVDAAGEALKIDSRYAPALEAQALALAASGQISAAWEGAERLLAAADPDDVDVLYFHARIANAARAYGRETESLQKIVKILEREGISATQFHVYLGQALAKQGFADLALAQFEQALGAGDLDAGRRATVEEAAQTLRVRVERDRRVVP